MHTIDHSKTSVGGISAARIADLRETEAEAFRKARPKSAAKADNGLPGFFGGVPMHWMNDWPTPFPILVDSARGAIITDIDGNRLDDFCLGDTGSMFGHSPPPVARGIRRQAGHGLTYMLPSEDAVAIGPLLQQRFGLPFWQIATTATDANRFALRVARTITGREKILVFNGCHHGSVDETMVRLVGG
ncbi:aminotransferase class III-fold pyridoxal phosphate-dependent enzyme, partial [Mesorhizobium sp.]